MKIFIFSWNTQSVRFYESLDEDIVTNNRKEKTSTWIYNGEYADFLPKIIEKIKEYDPEIVVFCFQEDVYPGSYFHSHLLKEEMSKLTYDFFNCERLLGIGKTSIKNLSNYDVTARGLITSIYIKEIVNFLPDSPYMKYKPAFYYDSIFRNKGAICIYITVPNRSAKNENKDKTIAVINCHLPFNSANLTESVIKQDLMIRQDSLNKQNEFFNEIYRKFVLNEEIVGCSMNNKQVGCSTNNKPTNLSVIFAGDFNYRMVPSINWSAARTSARIFELLSHFYFGDTLEDETEMEKESYREMFRQFLLTNDEYEQQKNKKNIYFISEGINDMGPLFPPTCKMNVKRNNELSIKSYKYGKTDQRVPSYCDRIFYSNLECKEYDIFDFGNISKSDHIALIGKFELNL